ncbi:MAG: 4Fe-4S dicluster domain-containing protein [Deltaproteobacteria bacterium]|jgi:2-oxoglutarate ferredoxin oxidoreductase subunit delta|nr:4Fe-4S dicluster domain-containing protein [Deltaproteobacteria bacterium]
MSRIAFFEERCKGCMLCAGACPRHLIRQSARLNRQGYRVAEADENAAKCTGCGGCAVMCPDMAIRVFKTKKTPGIKEARP